MLVACQCENGHIACSSCCTKIRNKCPSCCLPIGYNCCRAIEKVLESIKIKCQNTKYGCKETTSFTKKLDHAKTCHHAPCSYPMSDYNFVGSCTQLYKHFRDEHNVEEVENRRRSTRRNNYIEAKRQKICENDGKHQIFFFHFKIILCACPRDM
ncbi:hypothetical protein Patl1_32981 [Pistacia atlantica]|uniref:Uncharacterized protein n=1 Tax=Pistacia atlantica TaxID=434234 RepID=A0ACC1AMD7_9ROSI|nr:hypothetical protein Patl1_32981 [Pistacia atlantica]